MGEAILGRNGIPVSGGTITGSLKFLRGTRTDEPLRLYTGDANGSGLVIQAGGLTVVGGGEAGTSLYNALTTGDSPACNPGTEQLHLAADTTVNIHTNCNTIASRKTVTIDATGKITAPGGFGGNATNVTGVVAVEHGGTGKNTAPLGLYNLINGSAALAASGLATGDFIPLGDISAATGKKVTLANLVSYLNGTVVPSNIVVGSYTGNGDKSRLINLGFTPKCVLVCSDVSGFQCTISNSGYSTSTYAGGIATTNSPLQVTGDNNNTEYGEPDTGTITRNVIDIVTNGFNVHLYRIYYTQTSYSKSIVVATNAESNYHYIAIK